MTAAIDRLPELADQLPAALTGAAEQLGRTCRAALGTTARQVLATTLDAICRHASRGAVAMLDDVDVDDDRLAEILTVRVWLLAVAAGAARLGAESPEPESSAGSAGAEALRHRYQDDLKSAERDGLLVLIDDLLELN
jgi:hypothetical protein